MKQFKMIMLCVTLAAFTTCLAACGNDMEKPPYEDEVPNNTNNPGDTSNPGNTNNPGNTSNPGNTNNGGDNIGDDIKNGVDNIGDTIRDGVDNVEDGIRNGLDNMSDGMSRLEQANYNLMKSIREARKAIEDGWRQLSAQ